ncbi:hypothetical protein N9W21_07220 [Shewanella sp.]|nr:hypothetical protein [Shewanella sp.]
MNLKFKLTLFTLVMILANGCHSYSAEDYGKAPVNKKASSCVNMDSAQEIKCKESEESTFMILGADENCNHPYEYERNRCLSEKANQQKALDESLKKHTGK